MREPTNKVIASICIILGVGLALITYFWSLWFSQPILWPPLRLTALSLAPLLTLGGLFMVCSCCCKHGCTNGKNGNGDSLQRCLDNLNEAQEKLLLQDKLVQVGLLTAGIAHEIKNPLNFVTNFSKLSLELMEELEELLTAQKGNMNQEDQDDLTDLIQNLKTNTQKISEHGQRAESIVLNMLAQSRSEESVVKEPTEINPLVLEFLNLAYHGLRAQDSEFNIKIEKALQDSAGVANCIVQPLGRVILNILNNGMYAAHKKAQAKEGHQPIIKVSTFGDDKSVTIKIWDNGAGISKQNLENIFVPFYTTKPRGQGTGLGLSICHDIIVKNHHGKIEVDSVVGEFTEFTIWLPREGND